MRARKRLDLEASLYQTLQILSVNLFEKTPISQALQPLDMEANLLGDPNQPDSSVAALLRQLKSSLSTGRESNWRATAWEIHPIRSIEVVQRPAR